jgi:hypothetical protein
MPEVQKTEITRRLKVSIGELLGRPWHDLRRSDRLREDFGFVPISLLSLTGRLCEALKEFEIAFLDGDVLNSKTLGDLSDSAWKKYLQRLAQ